MNLPEFDYQTSTSRKNAVELLSELGVEAVLSAGGTDLIPNLKNGSITAKTLISLSGLSAEKEHLTGDGSLRLDALATLSEIAESPLINTKAPTLAAAALHVGGQQIRNRATMGGNLCQEIRCLYLNQSHRFQFVEPCYKRGGDCCYPYPVGGRSCRSVYMSDIAPVLITLCAQLVILSSTGEKVVDMNDFYTGDGLQPLNLGPAELITAILIPPESHDMQCHFIKATPRGGLEFAMVSVAVALRINGSDKKCGKARIAIGSVNTQPLRALQAEQTMTGQTLTEALAAKIAGEVAQEVKVLPHHGHSKGYLQQLVEVHTRRSLLALIPTP
ncbi:MAG: FAD binding domain-containing protein [SAR324 cluster bacterium]|nr:FAD binding domain-containing protein [SAR324 cluster bacterium]